MIRPGLQRLLCGSSALFLALLLGTGALAQDEVFIIGSPELEPRQRPGVEFPHEDHAARFDCGRCHHVYDQDLNLVDDEARACADCHNRSGEEARPGLKDAFHDQCQACHKTFLDRDLAGGPILCGACHRRE